MSWQVKSIGKTPTMKDVVLIEGLPGIGNVGKVAVDFMIEELKAKKIYEFFSYSFPHTVFINEDNLVELPTIEMYYAKNHKYQLLLLAGDIQPTDEVSSYEFSDLILNIAERFKTKHIITLGGIGLPAIPEKPKVYCTGNTKSIVRKYKKGTKLNDKLFGVVGPIIGVSGLLVGLAERRNIDAISLLAETYGHPMYLGVKGAREIVHVLNQKLELGIDIKKMDKEISKLESDMNKKAKRLKELTRQQAISQQSTKQTPDYSYIG